MRNRKETTATEAPARPYRLEIFHGSYKVTLHTAYKHPNTAYRALAERLGRGGTEGHLYDALTRELLAEATRDGLNTHLRVGRNLQRTINHEAPLVWRRSDDSKPTQPTQRAAGSR